MHTILKRGVDMLKLAIWQAVAMMSKDYLLKEHGC